MDKENEALENDLWQKENSDKESPLEVLSQRISFEEIYRHQKLANRPATVLFLTLSAIGFVLLLYEFFSNGYFSSFALFLTIVLAIFSLTFAFPRQVAKLSIQKNGEDVLEYLFFEDRIEYKHISKTGVLKSYCRMELSEIPVIKDVREAYLFTYSNVSHYIPKRLFSQDGRALEIIKKKVKKEAKANEKDLSKILNPIAQAFSWVLLVASIILLPRLNPIYWWVTLIFVALQAIISIYAIFLKKKNKIKTLHLVAVICLLILSVLIALSAFCINIGYKHEQQYSALVLTYSERVGITSPVGEDYYI